MARKFSWMTLSSESVFPSRNGKVYVSSSADQAAFRLASRFSRFSTQVIFRSPGCDSMIRISQSQLDLYAYSEFKPRDADASSTPAVIFTFLLTNPSRQTIRPSLLFVLPNHTDGNAASNGDLTFIRDGKLPLSGTIAVRTVGSDIKSSEIASEAGTASDYRALWKSFAAGSSIAGAGLKGEAPRYGAVNCGHHIKTRRNENRHIHFGVVSTVSPVPRRNPRELLRHALPQRRRCSGKSGYPDRGRLAQDASVAAGDARQFFAGLASRQPYQQRRHNVQNRHAISRWPMAPVGIVLLRRR